LGLKVKLQNSQYWTFTPLETKHQFRSHMFRRDTQAAQHRAQIPALRAIRLPLVALRASRLLDTSAKLARLEEALNFAHAGEFR
jgi:hypothetical protein